MCLPKMNLFSICFFHCLIRIQINNGQLDSLAVTLGSMSIGDGAKPSNSSTTTGSEAMNVDFAVHSNS